MAEVDSKHKINGEVYDAIMKGERNRVIDVCRKLSDHALHVMTVNDDTVLHMATYAKEADLVLKLLEELPEHHLDKLTRQNGVGYTILHEASTHNNAVPIADKLLKKSPGLLGMRCHLGETAIFRSAPHGKLEMFKFLASKISQYDHDSQLFYLQRRDKTTVLHSAIIHDEFDLALHIANEYKWLTGAKDSAGMTGLQLLACQPASFKNDSGEGFVNLAKYCWSSAHRQKVQKEKQKYEKVLKLAKVLVRRDTSWDDTYSALNKGGKPSRHAYGDGADTFSAMNGDAQDSPVNNRRQKWGSTPLLLATKYGITEIVEEILGLYPQAVEHVDYRGRNILHVAIKYRRLEIFELVVQMELRAKRLARKVDDDGNSILHTVALKEFTESAAEKVESPATLLQDQLLWFERVQEIIPPYLMYHHNNLNLTAKKHFNRANSQLRDLGKEWLKRTSEACSVVAVLIATVAFAAAYTVPGGFQSNSGLPVLLNQPLFVVFTVADALSLNFALTAVVTFLSILSSPFRYKDFRHSLPNKLVFGFTFLFLSVAMMMMAFGATVFLMIQRKENWTRITLYALSFLPVGIFGLAHFPLYSSLAKSYKYLLGKAKLPVSWNKCSLTSRNKSSPSPYVLV